MDQIVWLSTGEAAEILGLTLRTIYRLIDAGALPAYRFGRVIRIQETHLLDYIEQARIQPAALDR